ncbi:MAG: hypothetical protein ABIS50_12475 [Luteolibacter sp.]|uniref:hypothetical protein n=1 Tax=Luteolibacter sp. TaxID=1962973 RepID=UPI003265A25E
MKIPAMFLVLLAGWVAVSQSGADFMERVNEPLATGVTISLALAFLSSMAVVFARAGRIRLEEDRLVVSTPLGFSKIPYSRIETIRRCRRSGSAKRQYLQIIFESPGERKILQLRPHHLLEFTAQLRRKCPHLSSSSDACLVKQGGYDRLIHSA